MDSAGFEQYLQECRGLALDEIRALIPSDARYGPALYDLMMDYPMRSAKGFRPALCVAACRALGGHLEACLRTAAVLELYHNAFLIHDDVEDGSLLRRGAKTLHLEHGVPIAVNVGDAMLALSLEPLLDNMERVGLGKALRVLRLVARMARESAEGQALELYWVKQGAWGLEDEDYLLLVHKKTTWYTFLAPLLTGATLAGAEPRQLEALEGFGEALGAAFQIQDDLLNLKAPEGGAYGKESLGDLEEGKHTLILMHAMRGLGEGERAEALGILRTPRAEKTGAQVRRLLGWIEREGSLEYAARVARGFAARARARLEETRPWMPPSEHRAFLEALVERVVEREA
jgi:geranylgeranyl diphosphate synthase type II